MNTLMTLVRYEISCFLAALIAVVAFQMFSGKIVTQGMLSEKTSNGAIGVSPARVQLLLFTMAFAFYVFSQIADSVVRAAPGQAAQFPVIDVKWLLMLGGSHSIYLGGKAVPLIRSLLNSNEGD